MLPQLCYSKPLVYPHMPLQVGQEQGTFPWAAPSQPAQLQPSQSFGLRLSITCPLEEEYEGYQALEAARGINFPRPGFWNAGQP